MESGADLNVVQVDFARYNIIQFGLSPPKKKRKKNELGRIVIILKRCV